MCAEGPLSMHFLSYKGKGWCALLLLEPLSLSLNCTCRHYCLCDYRHSGELAVTHLLPPPSPITAGVPCLFLTTFTLEFPPFLLFALFVQPVILHWYNKPSVSEHNISDTSIVLERKNSQLWSSSLGAVCKPTTHGMTAQNSHLPFFVVYTYICKSWITLLALTFIMLYGHHIKIWSAFQNQAVSGSIILGLCFFFFSFFLFFNIYGTL